MRFKTRLLLLGFALAASTPATAACVQASADVYVGNTDAHARLGCGSFQSFSAGPGSSTNGVVHDPGVYTHLEVDAIGGSSITAHARSNLGDLSLHASVASQNGGTGFTFADWREIYTFTNNTGVNQYVTVGWQVEGLLALGGGSTSSAIANLSISGGGTLNQGGLGYYMTNGTAYDINGNYNAFGWWPEYPGQGGPFGASYEAYDLGGVSRLMTAVFGIAPGTHNVELYGFLRVNGAGTVVADYGNSVSFLMASLPDGVSVSGGEVPFNPGLLKLPGDGGEIPGDGGGTPGGVPEPASWAMFILGFGVVGAAARRRRTVRASN